MIEATRRDIRARRLGGESLEAVDRDVIAGARGLDEEQRAALWLYAWLCGSDAAAMGGMPYRPMRNAGTGIRSREATTEERTCPKHPQWSGRHLTR